VGAAVWQNKINLNFYFLEYRKCHISEPDWRLMYTNALLKFNASMDGGKFNATTMPDGLLDKTGTESAPLRECGQEKVGRMKLGSELENKRKPRVI